MQKRDMTMKKLLFTSTLLASVALASMAQAQNAPWDMGQPLVGKDANTFMVRLRAIGMTPEDSSSSISKIGGTVGATATAAPELDFSYFFTENIAAELIASTMKSTVSANNTAVGTFNVGTAWVLPPTLTVQYHFMPKSAFSPYIGAGLNITWFYATQAQYPVTHYSIGNQIGPALQIGFDYNVTGHWFLNMDVKQIFLNVSSHVDALGTTVKAHDAMNPLVVGLGVGYRF